MSLCLCFPQFRSIALETRHILIGLSVVFSLFSMHRGIVRQHQSGLHYPVSSLSQIHTKPKQ